MMYRLITPHRPDGLNEYITACRQNPRAGNAMKQRNEAIVNGAIAVCLRGIKIGRPVQMRWFVQS